MKCELLECPLCHTELHRSNNAFYCQRERPHCFNISKSGYATLTCSGGNSGDDKNTVKARSAFLSTGAYGKLSDEIIKLLAGRETVIDAGCGEGWYTNRFAEAGMTVMGFDLSKYACEHGAKAAKQSGLDSFFGVASLFELPVKNNSADAVTNIFAPSAEAEFTRILKDDGILITVGAGKRHLFELKSALYDVPYENEGRRDLPEKLNLLEQKNLTYKFVCEGENIKNLFLMTPYAFKTSRNDFAKLDGICELEITADFDIFVYGKENI